MILRNDQLNQDSMISPEEAMNVEVTSNGNIVSALLWLQTIVFFKEKKRNILLVVLSTVIIGLILLLQMVMRNIYKRCDDG